MILCFIGACTEGILLRVTELSIQWDNKTIQTTAQNKAQENIKVKVNRGGGTL